MKSYSKTALLAILVSFAGALSFFLSGYGYQWGWWGLGTAFRALMPAGVILASIALLLTIAYGFVSRSGQVQKGAAMVFLALFLSLGVLANAAYWYMEISKGYPPIHDITTDIQNPPQFKAIVPMREDAPNQTEYGGKEVAKMQVAHYKNIHPLLIALPPSKAFDAARAAARRTSWEIVAEDRRDLRIEATHTLPWYGFKDDIVIRIDTVDYGSKLDVRSVSRVGKGDLGVNAERIRDYLSRFRALLPDSVEVMEGDAGSSVQISNGARQN